MLLIGAGWPPSQKKLNGRPTLKKEYRQLTIDPKKAEK